MDQENVLKGLSLQLSKGHTIIGKSLAAIGGFANSLAISTLKPLLLTIFR